MFSCVWVGVFEYSTYLFETHVVCFSPGKAVVGGRLAKGSRFLSGMLISPGSSLSLARMTLARCRMGMQNVGFWDQTGWNLNL